MSILTVFVGAGASYDCVDRSGGMVGIEDLWRPPLVDQLFDPRESFAPILRHYPKAEALAGELRPKLRNREKGRWLPLEQLLKQASSAGHIAVRRRYWEVPHYLQELIGEVGTHFLRFGRPLYHQLVAEIAEAISAGRYSTVLFATVNYDLLLDQELEVLFDHRLQEMGRYISEEQWKLAKLHGSVNWGFRFAPGVANAREHCLAALSALTEQPTLSQGDLLVLKNHQTYCYDGSFIHPAMAVPIEGKSGFFCLNAIVKAARHHITRSTDFLILGCRMADEDVIELFQSARQVRRVKIVDSGLDSSLEILNRLGDRCEAFRPFRNRGECLFKGGFSDFIVGGELQSFLKGP